MSSENIVLEPPAAAAYLGLAVQTLARWRCDGAGPAYLKLGSRIRYPKSDLDSWMEERRRRSTSESRPLESAQT